MTAPAASRAARFDPGKTQVSGSSIPPPCGFQLGHPSDIVGGMNAGQLVGRGFSNQAARARIEVSRALELAEDRLQTLRPLWVAVRELDARAFDDR